MIKFMLLFVSMATPSLACNSVLHPFAALETGVGENMLILKSENNDPELVHWLNSLLEDSSHDPNEQAKRLTHLVYRRFDRPERFRGQTIDVIGRVVHRFRARSFIKTCDRP